TRRQSYRKTCQHIGSSRRETHAADGNTNRSRRIDKPPKPRLWLEQPGSTSSLSVFEPWSLSLVTSVFPDVTLNVHRRAGCIIGQECHLNPVLARSSLSHPYILRV